jgi:hypothetical protein
VRKSNLQLTTLIYEDVYWKTNNTLLMTNLLSSMKVDGCQFHVCVPLAGSHAVPPNKHTSDSLRTNPLKLFIIFFNLLILARGEQKTRKTD